MGCSSRLRHALLGRLTRHMRMESGNKEQLEKKLIGWLGKQGYPLELAVGKAFSDAGFTVAVSDFYRDPNSNKPREIDVTAARTEFPDGFILQLMCCAACKSTRKPWVVFTLAGQNPFNSLLPFTLLTDQIYRAFLQQTLSDESLAILRSLTFFTADAVSHGVTQAFSNSRIDVPYEAVLSAGNAGLFKIEHIEKIVASETLREGLWPIHVIVAAMVINAPLFSAHCHLTERRRSTKYRRQCSDGAEQCEG